MAAIFMKDKSNVFSSETPSKTFYCPSLPRQLATEFSMSCENKPMPNPPCGAQRKSRLTPAEIKYSGTNSKVYTADRAGESISQSQVDGTDSKDSILAKYIERFRHSKPCSRQCRPMKDEPAAFWWKDTEPDTPPQPACLRSPDLQHPQLYPFETPSTLSSSSHTEREKDKCEELIDKSEVILKSSCHGSSFPVQVGYRGTLLPTHHQPPLPTHHQPPLPTHHQPPLPTHHQPPLPTHHQPPLPTHHEDILYQWRLRRRLEQAQDIAGHCHIDPGDRTSRVPPRCCGSDDLASVKTLSSFTPPTSCCNGMHSVGVIPKTFDSVVNGLKAQDDVTHTEVSNLAVLDNEQQAPVTLRNLQSAGTQTTPDHSHEGDSPSVPLCDPNLVPCVRPKPSVLYPDTSLLTTTADSSLNNSNTSDFEQSFSTTSAEVQPLVSECVEQCLLHTTPHPVARPAGAAHISSSSDAEVSSMEDELLHQLIVRARLLKTQLRQIDSCLAAVEESVLCKNVSVVGSFKNH